MTDNLERLKDWIGKTEFMEERASTGRAQGLAALLDKPDTPHEGEPMGPWTIGAFSNLVSGNPKSVPTATPSAADSCHRFLRPDGCLAGFARPIISL